MKTITLTRYSPNGSGHLVTAQLVECYRDVFADEPWHEWLKCPRCQEYWGVKDRALLAKNNFRHCSTPLVDFWAREQVIDDLNHEITPESSCWLAIVDNKVIGFCWGYPIIKSQLETKLGITFNNKLECKDNELMAYQDELGVVFNYRKQKRAKAMFVNRLNDFIVRGLKIGIVRTRQRPSPSDTFLWYTKKLGYKIIASYPKNDGRVILGRNLNDLEELLGY
jgi:hypothetical protein